MNRLVVLLPLLLVGCAASPTRPTATTAAPAAPPPPSLSYAETNLNATLWAQGTVEHDMAYRSIYAQATRQIAAALKQKDWDAPPKSERKKPAKGPAGRDRRCRRNRARQLAVSGAPDSRRQGVRRIQLGPVVPRERALALPGALEFAQAAAAKRRDDCSPRRTARTHSTLHAANLRSAGFPIARQVKRCSLALETVVEGCEANGKDKGCRRSN